MFDDYDFNRYLYLRKHTYFRFKNTNPYDSDYRIFIGEYVFTVKIEYGSVYGIQDTAYDTQGNYVHAHQSVNGYNKQTLADSLAVIMAKQEYKASLDPKNCPQTSL